MENEILNHPTLSQSKAYVKAFKYFNERLFQNNLPDCILNFSRSKKKGSLGFFSPDTWQGDGGNSKLHEISVNPDALKRPAKDVMSTLCHEMAHLWQQEHGEPPSRCYHNKEWGGVMKGIGLYPSSTGEPGGKETGAKMTHYVVDGGLFDLAFQEIPQDALLPWTSFVMEKEAKPKAKSKDKVKYTCGCGKNIWAKEALTGVACSDCGQEFAADLDGVNEPDGG